MYGIILTFNGILNRNHGYRLVTVGILGTLIKDIVLVCFVFIKLIDHYHIAWQINSYFK